MDYKDKIRKLLALAQSPVEHEAKQALLKARKLMAEHKITETELRDVKKQVVKKVCTDISFSKRRLPWILELSLVIGESHCCQAYQSRVKGQQTQFVGFIGLEDDVEVCVTVFKYAVDYVIAKIEQMKKDYALYPVSHINSICNGYGYGFAPGLRAAFSEQKDENQNRLSLILVMPQEVVRATDNMKRRTFHSKAAEQLDPNGFASGYKDGKKFRPRMRITEKEAR